MSFYDKYQFVLDWDDLPENFREDKITEYIERGIKMGNYDDLEEKDKDPENLHLREEAEESIKAHFPIYF